MKSRPIPTPEQQNDIIGHLFNGCGDPCIVRYNEGGFNALFIEAAEDVLRGARSKVVIDGECLSGCGTFAGIAQERVCITVRARFGFHLARSYGYAEQRLAKGRVTPPLVTYSIPDELSEKILQWAEERGGLPKEGFLWMEYEEAKQFWQTCDRSGNEVAETNSEPEATEAESKPNQAGLRPQSLQPNPWPVAR
jgi:hypothetical protein